MIPNFLELYIMIDVFLSEKLAYLHEFFKCISDYQKPVNMFKKRLFQKINKKMSWWSKNRSDKNIKKLIFIGIGKKFLNSY